MLGKFSRSGSSVEWNRYQCRMVSFFNKGESLCKVLM